MTDLTKTDLDAIRARLDQLGLLMGIDDDHIALGAMIENEKTVVTWGELRTLLRHIDALKTALGFYANERHWTSVLDVSGDWDAARAVIDRGKRARDALGGRGDE